MNTEESIMDAIERVSSAGEATTDQKAEIAKVHHVPLSRVESLISFYEADRGEDRICTGLPCLMKRNGDSGSPEQDGLAKSSCLGYCDHAPVMRIKGKYVSGSRENYSEIPESTREYVTKTRETIEKYISRGGYTTLNALMVTGSKIDILSMVEKSGLKGMGGAGFPVAAKWKSFIQNRTDDSFLLVNAHEGEPGTFKDREILELNPHGFLEGALITARVNCIWKIVIGLKKEYKLAAESLEKAISEMREMYEVRETKTLLPEITVARVGGSYVTGEETALMEAIEGKRSEPRLRPPFPTEIGLFGKPTLVQNVETLAAVAQLSREKDGSIFKRYSVTGDVGAPGLYRIRIGSPAGEVIEKQGKTDLADVKAIMPGGLSGGMLPFSAELKLDFDSVRSAGAGFGTGAMIVLSRERCIIDTLLKTARFFRDESCGKCMPCRYGSKELVRILEDVISGKASEGELKQAMNTANAMIDGSICALGQADGRVFIDTVTRFGKEFGDHLDEICDAGVCRFGSVKQ